MQKTSLQSFQLVKKRKTMEERERKENEFVRKRTEEIAERGGNGTGRDK